MPPSPTANCCRQAGLGSSGLCFYSYLTSPEHLQLSRRVHQSFAIVSYSGAHDLDHRGTSCQCSHQASQFAVAALAPRGLCAAAEGQSAALFHIRGALPEPAPRTCESQETERKKVRVTWLRLIAMVTLCYIVLVTQQLFAAVHQHASGVLHCGKRQLAVLSQAVPDFSFGLRSDFMDALQLLHRCKVLVLAARDHRKSRQSRRLESSLPRPWRAEPLGTLSQTSKDTSQKHLFQARWPDPKPLPRQAEPWHCTWLGYGCISSWVTTLPDHGQFERKVALAFGLQDRKSWRMLAGCFSCETPLAAVRHPAPSQPKPGGSDPLRACRGRGGHPEQHTGHGVCAWDGGLLADGLHQVLYGQKHKTQLSPLSLLLSAPELSLPWASGRGRAPCDGGHKITSPTTTRAALS